jgi:hypothetical protein
MIRLVLGCTDAIAVNMLRVCITVVSLLAVLAHVTVGCCLHHAHAAESPPAAGACSAGHHHHGGTAQPDENGPLPWPSHDDCHEAHCFVALASPTNVPDHVDFSFDLVNLPGGDEAAQSATTSAVGEILADASRPPPLRAHLRYCVLLN